MSAFLVATLLLAQTQDKKPVPPYVGEWVTIQAEGVQGKEDLKIAKDGTFTMTLTIPNQKDSLAKGHYTVKADEMPPGTEDKRDCTIYLSLENLNGTDIPKEKV